MSQNYSRRFLRLGLMVLLLAVGAPSRAQAGLLGGLARGVGAVGRGIGAGVGAIGRGVGAVGRGLWQGAGVVGRGLWRGAGALGRGALRTAGWALGAGQSGLYAGLAGQSPYAQAPQQSPYTAPQTGGQTGSFGGANFGGGALPGSSNLSGSFPSPTTGQTSPYNSGAGFTPNSMGNQIPVPANTGAANPGISGGLQNLQTP